MGKTSAPTTTLAMGARRPPPPSAPLLPPAYMPPNSVVYEEERDTDHYALVEPPSSSRSPLTLCYILLLAIGALLALVGFGAALACALWTPASCPLFTGLWVCPLCLCNALLGLLGALSTGRHQRNLRVAHLAFSVLAFCSSLALLLLTGAQWMAIGRAAADSQWLLYYKDALRKGKPPPAAQQPDDDPFCLIPSYDADRISYVYQFQGQFDFAACLQRHNWAVTLLTASLATAVALAMLSLVSATVSACQLGNCVRRRWRCC